MPKKRVAIILINWNSFNTTDDCIVSLKNTTTPIFDIIVVDNASVDQSADQLMEKHPEIILIKSPTNRGFTGGNNIGFQYSIDHGYAYSLMQNNDTFVEPDYLLHLVDYLDQHPEVGAAQPRIFYHPKRNLIWDGGSYFSRFLGYTYTKGVGKPHGDKYNSIKQVDWITGCALFVRNSVLVQTGLLAENMFMNFEDVDLSFRIKALGYRLMYLPSSVIYHITSMSLKSATKGAEGFLTPAAHYRNFRNRIWILKRYTPWYFIPSTVLFNVVFLSLFLSYFIVRRRFKKLKAALKGIQDGLSGSIVYEP